MTEEKVELYLLSEFERFLWVVILWFHKDAIEVMFPYEEKAL